MSALLYLGAALTLGGCGLAGGMVLVRVNYYDSEYAPAWIQTLMYVGALLVVGGVGSTLGAIARWIGRRRHA